MDEHDFERMMGKDPKTEPEESEEERAAREERIGTPEMTMGDLFHKDTMGRIFDQMEEDKKAILDHYGLQDRQVDADREAEHEALFAMLSDEQEKQYNRAVKAYLKRSLPTFDAEGDLLSFAVESEPKVLSRHIWRLQRGMDEPMYGPPREPEELPNWIENYRASLVISLCHECAEELREETEAAGAEPPMYGGNKLYRVGRKELTPFYDRRGGPTGGYYMFKYRNMWLDHQDFGSLFGDHRFPYSPPKTCHRCGVTDVDLWRERYGDA
jgi:hypothetical protein